MVSSAFLGKQTKIAFVHILSRAYFEKTFKKWVQTSQVYFYLYHNSSKCILHYKIPTFDIYKHSLTLQQKVSLYAKWFQDIFSDFIDYSEQDLVGMQWIQ
jgi:hypothetical protein